MSSSNLSLSIASEWDSVHPVTGAPSSAPNRNTVFKTARNAYLSFRIVIEGEGGYSVKVTTEGDFEADLYKVWYHKMNGVQPDEYRGDALIPLPGGGTLETPDPDNRIPNQRFAVVWTDIFIPAETLPGRYRGSVRLDADTESRTEEFMIEIKSVTAPDEPSVILDNNSYGCRWLPKMYPKAYAGMIPGSPEYWNKTIDLLHHYYRISHEHRMTMHNLGYGHSGDFDPIYGPVKTGAGRSVELNGWELYDRHYGPLLDGSLFETPAPGAGRPRRKAAPIWGIYTPINPDWPGNYLYWDQPGYEVEMIRGLRDFDAHFRENGWTSSKVEFFFNHKKRYRWFEWDGDEQKFYKDFYHHTEMIRIWEKATDASPVNWVYRADASWYMQRQFAELGGHRNFWVCGGFLRWYPEEAREVRERGEILWNYGGYPSISQDAGTVLQTLWKAFLRNLDGFCYWLATSPGDDPWFACDGAATGVMYPGERFGIDGPIPSIRLKVLRNGIQDIDIIRSGRRGTAEENAKVVDLGNSIGIEAWEAPPLAACTMDPEDWDSRNLQAEHEPTGTDLSETDTAWWTVIRDYAFNGDRDE